MIFPPGWLAHQTGLGKSLLFLLIVGLAVALHRRKQATIGIAVSLAFAGSALWVVALGRPYGVFVDEAITTRTARIMVAASTGAPRLLGGTTAEPSLPAGFAAWGVPPGLLLLTFHAAPIFATTGFVFLLGLGVRDRDDRGLAALLGALLSFSDLDLIAGTALAPLSWTHPRAGLLGLALLFTFGAARRLGLPVSVQAVVPALGLAVATSAGLSPGPTEPGAWLMASGALIPFVVVGILARSRDSVAMIAALGLWVMTTAAFVSTGSASGFIAARGLLILALTPAIADAVRAADTGMSRVFSRALPGPGGALALLFLAVAPSTAPFAWRPTALDRVAEESVEAPSPTLVSEMLELARATAPSDVIVASPGLAPWVGAIAGRRVLRAPSLVDAPDDAARTSAEFMILRGRAPARLLNRFGVTHVLVAPGDFTDRGVLSPKSLETRPGFTLVREGAARFRLYRVTAAASGGGG